MKKQENMTHTQEIKSVQTSPKMTQLLKLGRIWKQLQEIKLEGVMKKLHIMNETEKFELRNQNHKKEKSRTEKYNL